MILKRRKDERWTEVRFNPKAVPQRISNRNSPLLESAVSYCKQTVGIWSNCRKIAFSGLPTFGRKGVSNSRMTQPRLRLLLCCLLIFCAVPAFSFGSASDAVMQTMQQELKRATAALAKSDPAPYYLSYAVTDTNAAVLYAENGGLLFSTSAQRRQVDVMMRVGSAALDNTHNKSRATGITTGFLPLNDDSDAIARVLWQLTDREYEQASSAF